MKYWVSIFSVTMKKLWWKFLTSFAFKNHQATQFDSCDWVNLRIQGLQWCRYFARVFLLILSSRIMSKHLVFPSSLPPKIPTYSSNPLPPLSLTSKSTLSDLNMTPNASLLHPKAAIMMRVEPLLFLAFSWMPGQRRSWSTIQSLLFSHVT